MIPIRDRWKGNRRRLERAARSSHDRGRLLPLWSLLFPVRSFLAGPLFPPAERPRRVFTFPRRRDDA